MKKAYGASIFVLGFVLGVVGFDVAGKSGLAPYLTGISSETNGTLTDACVPTQTSDDIFFVSCGGIY